MMPDKLKIGDEIRVVAPARSMRKLPGDLKKAAQDRLEQMGLRVTYARNIDVCDMLGSSSIEKRVEDLHEAFSDQSVKCILPVFGGGSSNQLLRSLDYDLIKQNPKILCGFSDITAIQNAIYAKTGMVTYSGPFFSSFAMKKGFEYSVDFFKRALFQKEPFEIKASEEWSDDKWYRNQDNRSFIKNEGYCIINEGIAQGTIIGGNLSTFHLLVGTEFMPKFDGSILFLEIDSYTDGTDDVEFERLVVSLTQQKDFQRVQAIVIGRFQNKSDMTIEKLRFILNHRPDLCGIPIIANADFGHTVPIFTFPIGGCVELKAVGGQVRLKILEG